ncbi:MAG: D-alanyl-D-alanine carboxypeptidase [Lachnospiraceae bacterium]|nr:D-alanyl-D-alanine carboxypeptidase [Lachnospiraceae bacterium]
MFSAFSSANAQILFSENNTDDKASLLWPTLDDVLAPNAILIDADTGMILFEKNISEAKKPASTTKIMTSLLAIEHCPLTDIVTTPKAVEKIDQSSSRIGIVGGEELTLEDALYGVLLESGNDAAYAVGAHVAKGSIEDFVDMMNNKAEAIGCINTHFCNPHGLDEPEHYTCAYDLALMMKEAVKYSSFCNISNTPNHTIPPTNKNVQRIVANTHRMINYKKYPEFSYKGILAGKTGFTDAAGTCIVTAATRDNLTLIAVVMNERTALNAYDDTKTLLDFGFDNFEIRNISSETDNTYTLNSLFSDNKTLITDVVAPINTKPIALIVPKSVKTEDLTSNIVLQPLESFKEGFNIIGQKHYYFEDKYLGSADIAYKFERNDLSKLENNTSQNQADTESADNLVNKENTSNSVNSDFTDNITGNSANKGNSSNKDSSAISESSNAFSKFLESEQIKYVLITIGVIILILAVYFLAIELPYKRKQENDF